MRARANAYALRARLRDRAEQHTPSHLELRFRCISISTAGFFRQSTTARFAPPISQPLLPDREI